MHKLIKMVSLQACLMLSLLAGAPSVYADTPFIGEVRWFAGNFAPRGWAFCDGQLLPIAQNTALFAVLGTTYGGDGRTTLGLPDMRGRAMMNWGPGPGLTTRQIGVKSGTEAETVSNTQMPNHNHQLMADSSGGDDIKPNDRVISKSGRLPLFRAENSNVAMGAHAIGNTGGNQAHNNMQPYITMNCIIALTGLFPSRN